MCQILFGVRWLTWSDSNHVWSFLSHLKQLSTSSHNSGLKSKKENSFLKFWLFGGFWVGLMISFVIDESGFDLVVESLHIFFCTILVNFDNSPPAVCFFKQFKMSTKQLHGKIVVGVVQFSSYKTLAMYKFCCKFCNVRYIISKQCKKWENFWHYSKYLIWPTTMIMLQKINCVWNN